MDVSWGSGLHGTEEALLADYSSFELPALPKYSWQAASSALGHSPAQLPLHA